MELCTIIETEMRGGQKVLSVASFARFILYGVVASAQPDDSFTWNSSAGQWDQTGSSWQLNANAAGQAWVYACLNNIEIGEDSLGRSARMRWSASFAGSINNFSRLHFFSAFESQNPPSFPISEWTADENPLSPGGFLHLGTNGSQDAIEWRRINESLEIGEDFPLILEVETGVFAEGIDAWITWNQLPGDSLATFSIESLLDNGTSFPISFHIHPMPTCVGLSSQFTISNADGVQFELEQFGAFHADTIAPRLDKTSWEGDSVLLWHFNEPIRSNLGNINTSIGPVVLFPEIEGATKTFRMPFDTHWIAGSPRNFSLFHFTDLAGNMLADTNAQLIWTPPNVAKRGEIIFTEIMADPTPHAHLPNCEWAEVLNRSEYHFDIHHWNWWDEGASELIPLAPRPPWDGILSPGERFLISGCNQPVSDEGILEAHLEGAAVFNDAGDGLGLIRNDGLLLDAIHYLQSWWQGPNDGVSLQILHTGACASRVNWIRSDDPNGCTPGTASTQEISVPFENDRLTLHQTVPTSSRTGFIDFIEAIDPLSEWEASPIGSASWTLDEANPNRMHWTLLNPILPQTTHLALSQLKSCHSDWSIDSEFSIKINIETEKFPGPGDLVISEVLANPQGTSDVWGEFIEVYNPSDSMTIELGGIHCGDWICNERNLILPLHRVVINPGDLPNEKGIVQLQNAFGTVIDEVRYSACWHPNRHNAESGFSLVRIDLHGPSQNNENWTSSGEPSGASPNTEDPSEKLDSWQSKATMEFFEEVFLLHGNTSTDTYFLFSQPVGLDTLIFRPVTSQEGPSWFQFANANSLWAQSAEQPVPDSILAQNASGQTQWLQTKRFQSNSNDIGVGLHLNEILHTDAHAEPFIEVKHTRHDYLETAHWFISTEVMPFPSDWTPLSPAVNWYIPPHEPWAFAACPNRLNTARAIAAEIPSLYAEEQVHLQSPEHTIETVLIQSELHAPWAIPERTSLERLQSMDQALWQSSTDSSGSTPGKQNSWNFPLRPLLQSLEFPSIKIIQRTWSSHSPMPKAVIFSLQAGESPIVWQAHISIVSASGQIIWRFHDKPWLAPDQPAWVGAWDGRNEHGILAAPGSYLLQIIFQDPAMDRRILRVSPIHVAPAPF